MSAEIWGEFSRSSHTEKTGIRALIQFARNRENKPSLLLTTVAGQSFAKGLCHRVAS
jgi:hypothetical protein